MSATSCSEAEMRAYSIIAHGPSRSFPEQDPFLAGAQSGAAVQVHVGVGAREPVAASEGAMCVLIEVDLECLGVHTDEHASTEGDSRVGFARWQLGDSAPSNLV